jgi:hypothetical protein
MHLVLHVKYPLLLSDFIETLTFLDRFLENNEISNFMKIRRVATELFHAGGRKDGWTDMRNVIVAFHNFATPPKMFQIKQSFNKFFAFSVTSQHVTSQHILITGYGKMMCLGKRDAEISHSITEGNLLT